MVGSVPLCRQSVVVRRRSTTTGKVPDRTQYDDLRFACPSTAIEAVMGAVQRTGGAVKRINVVLDIIGAALAGASLVSGLILVSAGW
jgi:hypothetical protein